MIKRPRRLRHNLAMREMVRETTLERRNLVYPLFVVEGENIKEEISSLKGIFHFSLDRLEEEIKELVNLGIQYVILFGIPNEKDAFGKEAYSETGIVQEAIRKVKEIAPDMYVITDVCMCQYTSHGHCGILNGSEVDNDKTLEILGKIALSHAKAGAHMVAPSDMMDGRIAFMRNVLDENGYENVAIMSYAAKYSSFFYGPFREAAHSAPQFGDRKTYQMDPANSDEAIREIEWDINEGADIIIVKPAMSYLDIIRRAKDKINVSICASNA